MADVNIGMTLEKRAVQKGEPVKLYLTVEAGPNEVEPLYLTGAKFITNFSPAFQLVRVVSTTQGSAAPAGSNGAEWDIGTLGQTAMETAEAVYEVRYTGEALGMQPVTAGNTLAASGMTPMELGDPQVEILAAGTGVEIVAEACPAPTDITVSGCQDAVHAAVPGIFPASLGRIVQMDVTVKSVCPGKRVAVSVILEETDGTGMEYPRGVKHFLIPAQTGTTCQDITLRCVQFSLPEALTENPDSICGARSFHARVIANYVDTDYACCEVQTVV